MASLLNFDLTTLCPDHRFLRVACAEGVFYDLVPKWRVREHLFRLHGTGFLAQSVTRAKVPPCKFRDFTELNGPGIYREAMWRNGTSFYFPLTPEDMAQLHASLP
ncbi:MAG: hypothetical protein IKT58_04545 [Oscillospiraceae bacterium]|nr:hypothetical protein [Oscillospiraceae bacterium]